MSEVRCIICNNSFNVVPARLKTAKFCSYKCAGEWRKTAYLGNKSPRYNGGGHVLCKYCGKEYYRKPCHAETRKFCSKACADKGGLRYSGKDHPNYRENARRRNRGGSHHKWANSVISRDKATCMECGLTDIEMHAHHIKSYKDFPDLRFDINNGITLCYKCHWKLHTALNAKAVNSGNIPPANAEDNPEPSIQGNLIEGVTTRGRAYRRIVVPCSWCGNILSKRLSDIANRNITFCDKSCAGKYTASKRTKANGSKASKSPAPERDDIV